MGGSDQELLARYRQGDLGALETLVEQYRRPLFAFILNLLDRREEADDIFQEVWLRAIKAMDRYRDDRFLSWLFRIARNLIIDRRRSRRPLVSLEADNAEGVALEDVLPDGIPNAANVAANRDLARLVKAAVAGLPLAQREVFLMRTEGELPFKEIARIQQVSINTALARMQYALEKLRALLPA